MLGPITFFPKNTTLNGGFLTPGTYESPVFDCSGADTLVAFLDAYYARGTGPTLDSVILVSEDADEPVNWTSLGNMTSVTLPPFNERKQFQNLRGWRFLRVDLAINASAGDSDYVLELTGELFRTDAAGT